jgi:hypothetical protein
LLCIVLIESSGKNTSRNSAKVIVGPYFELSKIRVVEVSVGMSEAYGANPPLWVPIPPPI